MKLYYLHGFRSHHCTATKLIALRDYYVRNSYPKACSVTMENIEYNPHDAFETMEKLDSIFSDLEEESVVVGCSLGGFWATYVATKYGIQAIVINPSTKPHKTLPVGRTTVYQTNEFIEVRPKDIAGFKMLSQINLDRLKHTAITCVLSEDDDVLDYNVAKEYYKNKDVIVIPKGGHSLDSDTWDTLVDSKVGKYLFWMAG